MIEVVGTIMFTDIVESSTLWANYPKKMNDAILKHGKIISDIVKKNKGMVVKTIGDAFMIYFKNSYENALACAAQIQHNFTNSPIILEGNDKIKIRIGLCYGTFTERIIHSQGARLKDYFGTVVNIASRMESKVSRSDTASFAMAFYVNKIVPEDGVVRFAKFYRLNVYEKEFSNKCGQNPVRSRRLISYDCDNIEKLHGVPALISYLFTLA